MTRLVEAVIARLRSASGLIVVRSVEELLAGLKSASNPATFATLVATPLVAAVVVMVTRAFVPLTKGTKSQIKTPSTLLHVPWVLVAETNVTEEGSVSVSTNDVAIEGPLLFIVIV